MKNEIGRKITSLTLMTIMVAGGLTFAMPSIMPDAYAATENLYVSAENSAFDNSFAGPMVIEVVINDPDLKETDQTEATPDVTVNGATLTMVQARDGNWYAYIAETTMATRADAQAVVFGTSLDFGVGCTTTDLTGFGERYSDTDGVYFNDPEGGNDLGGLDTCTGIDPDTNDGKSDNQTINVVREPKEPSVQNSNIGQINLNDGEFPAIQLFDFSVDGTVEVKYNKGGGTQEIELTYLDDADSYASLELDRTSYPQGAHVHATITDLQLNIDPTDEDSWTFGTNADHSTGTTTHYLVTDENGDLTNKTNTGNEFPALKLGVLNFDDNGVLILDVDTQSRGHVLRLADNTDQSITVGDNVDYLISELVAESHEVLMAGSGPVTFVETQANSGIFKNTDEGDNANIRVTDEANRGTSATITYNDSDQSILIRNYFGTMTIDQSAVGDAWNSGETIPVTLVDEDLNRNSLVDEDLDLNNADLIPAVRIGNPITLGSVNADNGFVINTVAAANEEFIIDGFSDRVIFRTNGTDAGNSLRFTLGESADDYNEFMRVGEDNTVFYYVNYDFRSFGSLFDDGTLTVTIGNGLVNNQLQNVTLIAAEDDPQGTLLLNNDVVMLPMITNGTVNDVTMNVDFGTALSALPAGNYPFVLDIFRFGQVGDGVAAGDRLNDAIYRMELEETGDNTGTFTGSMEYVMLNQINVMSEDTYGSGVVSVDDAIELIVHNDLTDEDSVRVTYFDVGQDGVATQVSAQVAAPTHTGVVTFDADNYKIADTVTITLNDPDLNTDVERVDIFTVVDDDVGDEILDENDMPFDPRRFEVEYNDLYDQVGVQSNNGSLLLEVTFDDAVWQRGDIVDDHIDRGVPFADILDADDKTCHAENNDGYWGGLVETGFTLIETESGSGIFTGNFQVPKKYCDRGDREFVSTTGVDMEVNYYDFRDNSGEITETGDSAGIRANTGSVSLDRSVYPVPWGTVGDFGDDGIAESGDSVFQLHERLVNPTAIAEKDTLGNGDLMIHVRINDPDYDISASGEDVIAEPNDRGPLLVKVSRGSDTVILATAGAEVADGTHIYIGGDADADGANDLRELGPISEIAPDAGIFEADIPIRYSDGPASANCPETTTYVSLDTTGVVDRFWNGHDFNNDVPVASALNHCILQGDILTVEYTDPTDASGEANTVTDSATFDLRNGVLQSDKSVYIIGGDMILTLIEPDFDRDNDETETYDLDLIEWDSDAADVTMGDRGGETGAFDPEPSALRETGDSTGIFQAVIEIPSVLGNNDALERGEEIELEYVDWGPAGANYVGEENEDVNLTVFTSNFGATIELDQNVYSWTDKVHITIIAPDHNFDSNLVDEIGDERGDIITVSTGEGRIDRYKLVETGADTGIFTGEVILTGFTYDLYGNGAAGDLYQPRENSPNDSGPTDGFLQAEEDDGFSVSFEFSEDETVTGTSLIRWNFGEVQWLQASYPASASGVVRVIDPDMNLDPESVNNFDVDVTSNSDVAGIDLTVTETNESTGIFEGTVTFTTTDSSSGHRLRVAEGDTVTAEYTDYTLPDPKDRGDSTDITGTTFIGTLVAPLERAVITEPRILDTSGNTLTSVSVGQQITISADLTSGQGKDSPYAYLVQIQDENGVTLALTWDSGTLAADSQSTKAQSWTPEAPGQYTATIFVWESVGNPIAMSPPAVVPIPVS